MDLIIIEDSFAGPFVDEFEYQTVEEMRNSGLFVESLSEEPIINEGYINLTNYGDVLEGYSAYDTYALFELHAISAREINYYIRC